MPTIQRKGILVLKGQCFLHLRIRRLIRVSNSVPLLIRGATTESGEKNEAMEESVWETRCNRLVTIRISLLIGSVSLCKRSH